MGSALPSRLVGALCRELGWHRLPNRQSGREGGLEARCRGPVARRRNLAGESRWPAVCYALAARCAGKLLNLRDKHDEHQGRVATAAWERQAGSEILGRLSSAEN